MVSLTVLALILLVGAGLAGPYLTLYQIRVAIKEQDAERLAEQVDFPALRANLKDQIKQRMTQATPPRWRDNPLSALADGLGSQLVDHAVDALITPPGLASLMAGRGPRPAGLPPADPETPGTKPPVDPFRDAHTHFANLSRFSVEAHTARGDPIRFELTRSGLKWRLSNILLPESLGTPATTGAENDRISAGCCVHA